MPRGWPPDRDRLLIRLYREGYRLHELAAELSISEEDINQRLRELDRRPRTRGASPSHSAADGRSDEPPTEPPTQ